MRRDDVLERLNLHREELRTRFGVGSIALFGSYARDEARPDSDVDLLVEFERPPTFLSYMDLIDYLEQLLGRGWTSPRRKSSSPAPAPPWRGS